MGDVIDTASSSVLEMLRTQTFYYKKSTDPWNAYVKPLSYFESISAADLARAEEITLVGGLHMPQEVRHMANQTRSCIYLQAIRLFFEGKGCEVHLRLNHPPDDDFVYMSNAPQFLQSGGGFSALIAQIVRANHGHVLGLQGPKGKHRSQSPKGKQGRA